MLYEVITCFTTHIHTARQMLCRHMYSSVREYRRADRPTNHCRITSYNVCYTKLLRHSHNIKTNLGDIEKYEYKPVKADYKVETNMSFMGYRRQNGKVGVRNEIWIIPTVGCINGIAKTLENMSIV